MQAPPSIVILTDAGISRESGLATFRDADGICQRVRIEDVATPEAFTRDPDRVQAFYNARRAQLRDPAIRPNAAHAALAELERRWPGDAGGAGIRGGIAAGMAVLSRGLAAAALLAALLMIPAGGTIAQGLREASPALLRPGIGAEDPRQVVDPAAEPWRALGRVQTELGTRCTGALIGPRTVLTAAHCLIAPRARQFVQPGSVHFMLGYHLGRYVAHARVASYSIGPGFRPAPPGPGGADWALLTLEQPIGTPERVLPLLRDPPAPRTPLMLGGYQRDRPELLMADTGCRSLGLQRGSNGQFLLVHDCAGTRGVSGAPLLARGPDGHWAIAGVASSVSPDIALGRAVPAASVGPVP